ncbi:MAG: hypothetical protein WA192_13745 [Candidatus Acidiferrales bacterium]
MKIGTKTCLTLVAALGLTLPLWARTDTIPLVVDHPVAIGAQQLPAGSYNLKTKDSDNQITIRRAGDGKVVASVPFQWIDLPQKARQSEVLLQSDRVVQIEFGGQTKAIQFR